MTRIEKWKSYREEIDKHSRISGSIGQDNAKIANIKHEIKKINPSILTLSENEVALIDGVSEVKIDKTEISSEISDMFNTVTNLQNVINEDNVETLFHQMKNNTIIENNEIKQEFLNSSDKYKTFQTKAQEFLSSKNAADTSKELETKHNKLKQKPNPDDVQPIEPVQLLANNNQKQAGHYVFIISIAVSAFLLLIVMALFVARLVIK